MIHGKERTTIEEVDRAGRKVFAVETSIMVQRKEKKPADQSGNSSEEAVLAGKTSGDLFCRFRTHFHSSEEKRFRAVDEDLMALVTLSRRHMMPRKILVRPS